jgi:tetratricopeptide (TPR) repeat protein
MKIAKQFALLALVSLIGACSQSQDTEMAGGAATTEGNDGGIPLSAASEAAMAIYAEVRSYVDNGDFIKANQAARRLTAEAPEFPAGWIMLSNTSLSGEQFTLASTEALKLAENGTQGEQLWAGINMSFIENDSYKGLRLGKELVETYPDSPRAWVVYSGLLTGQNMHEQAREAGAKAIDLAPDEAYTHNNLGFSFLNNAPKDFAKAEEHFMHASSLEPEEDSILVNIGDAHRALRRLEEARDDYTAALKLDPTNAVAAIKRGHVNSFLGNYDEARADYDNGIANGEEGNQTTLAVYRAFVNVHAGDSAAAVAELWDELDKIDSLSMPSDQKLATRIFVLTNIADICFHEDMTDEAQNAVYKLTAAFGESGVNSGDENFARLQKAAATFWRGKLEAHQGNYEQAAARAEELAEIVEDDDNPRRMENFNELLALIAWKQGDHATAIEHYADANMSTAPNFGDVKNLYRLAVSLRETGEADEATALMDEIANWNFNSAWFAMLRDEAGQS